MGTQALKSRTALSSSLDEFPVRVPRDRAAELVTQRYFEISPRSLERAPLCWQRLNGKAHVLTTELFGWAESVLDASPVVMGGRRTTEPKAA